MTLNNSLVGVKTKVNMSSEAQNTTQNSQEAAQKTNDKEYNFGQMRQQLEREKQARLQAEQEKLELQKQLQSRSSIKEQLEDDDDDEPYVDPKKLERKLAAFEKKLEPKIDQLAEKKARMLVDQERQQSWLRANPDFYDVMQHAQTFAERDPELAETILTMPEGFERQKLVYKNIKALGIHKKEEPKTNIQDKIEQNRRSPYYQPSGFATPGYGVMNGGKDYSPADGQNAYKKMQELKSKLRL